MTIQDTPIHDKPMLEEPALDESTPDELAEVVAALSPYDGCPDSDLLDWRQWLPSVKQMRNALRLNLDDAIDGDAFDRAEFGDCPATSMREGMGMITLTALLAGLVSFVLNWIMAARWETVAPLLNWAQSVNQPGFGWPGNGGVMAETASTIAGLDSWLPAWLAAGLSALGVWLSMPLEWLAIWITYGLGVLVIAHFMGATTTLPRFYGGVSYAVLPLAFYIFTPALFIGPLIRLGATIWALIIFVRAVKVVTGLETARAILSTLLPWALMLLVSLIAGFFFATLTVGALLF